MKPKLETTGEGALGPEYTSVTSTWAGATKRLLQAMRAG
jgi:hypothetical protein